MSDDAANSVILVVDDEAIILWGTASLLESLGYVVIRASSGAAALKILNDSERIDALLTDFQMPAMSGVELADNARRLRPGIPIIIATGDQTLRSSVGRFSETLAKPFTLEDLDEALKRTLAAVSKA